ncbi:HD domain-containing protein [Candidatus Pacearchaeota archaeon]|nr:HD domain-containing protein [Candidatus Pacearchaeota archaeon]
MTEEKNIVNFLFEAGMLSKTPRSGFYFLGSGEQSVAEHVNRVCYIGYTLAMLDGKVDIGKILKMCLLHDLAEARTSDLNYVHQKYAETKENDAIKDLASTLPFGQDIHEVLREYHEGRTQEALYSRDADKLELILSLKEQYDTGNRRAKTWFNPAFQRLKTGIAQSLAKQVFETESDEWWYNNKEDRWWVTRGKE